MVTMDNKTWLIEAEVAVCIVAMAIVAFTLMVGDTLWSNLVGTRRFPIHVPAR
jgi:hypothetical protein